MSKINLSKFINDCKFEIRGLNKVVLGGWGWAGMTSIETLSNEKCNYLTKSFKVKIEDMTSENLEKIFYEHLKKEFKIDEEFDENWFQIYDKDGEFCKKDTLELCNWEIVVDGEHVPCTEKEKDEDKIDTVYYYFDIYINNEKCNFDDLKNMFPNFNY